MKFIGQFEVLDPRARTVYIEFIPEKAGDTGEVYTVELRKTQLVITDFLKKIKARAGKGAGAKISSYGKFAKNLIDQRLGEIVVDDANIKKLINKFNIRTRAIEGLIRFTKKFITNSPVRIGEKIYPKNSVLKFTYEG